MSCTYGSPCVQDRFELRPSRKSRIVKFVFVFKKFVWLLVLCWQKVALFRLAFVEFQFSTG